MTGKPDDGLRHLRRGRLLLLETISEPDVEAPGSCGHLGPLTNALFPVMRAGEKPTRPAQTAETGRTARAYLTLFSGDNAGNDHRFFVNAADYTAPPLAERKALIASGESAGWRLVEETPAHIVLRHKTGKLEVELSVRKLDREFIQTIEDQLNRLDRLEKEGKTEELAQIRSAAPKAIPRPMMRTLWRLLLSGRIKSRLQEVGTYQWQQRFLKKELKVEFGKASSSFLIYQVTCHLEGGGASYYFQIFRDIQRYSVEACQKNNWAIVLLENT